MKLHRHRRGQGSNSVHCCSGIAHNCDIKISSLHFVVQIDEFHIFYSVVYLPRVTRNRLNDQLSVGQKTKRIESIAPVSPVVGFQFLFSPELFRPHYLYCLSSSHNCKIMKSTFLTPQFKCMSFICSITDSVSNG